MPVVLRSQKNKSSGEPRVEPSGDAKKRVKVSGDEFPKPISVSKVEAVTPSVEPTSMKDAVSEFNASPKKVSDYLKLYKSFGSHSTKKDFHAMLLALPTSMNIMVPVAAAIVFATRSTDAEYGDYISFFMRRHSHFVDAMSRSILHNVEQPATYVKVGLALWTVLLFGKEWKSALCMKTLDLKPSDKTPNKRVAAVFARHIVNPVTGSVYPHARKMLGDVFFGYLDI